MLVPEGRHEITTEGGLDIVVAGEDAQGRGQAAADAGIVVSVFIDADLTQVEAAERIGAAVCEIHTGPYAHAFHSKGRDAESPAVVAELEKIQTRRRRHPRARHALQRRPRAQLLQRAAGRARCPACASCTSATPSSAARVFVGMREAVREMKALMVQAAR